MSIERTIFFLMANLGSDMFQSFLHIEKNEMHLAKLAATRAQRIIDELLARTDLCNGVKEVQILENILDDAFSDTRQFDIEKREIEEYFMPFALRVLSKQHIF